MFLHCCGLLHAQSASFVGYTGKDGLNDNHVNGICQDSRGFYWISSHGGINRFDGRFFKSFSPGELADNPRLTDNAHVIFESRPNKMIVAVGNGQIHELDCIFPRLEPVSAFAERVAQDYFRLDANTILIGCTDTAFVVDNRFNISGYVTLPPKSKAGLGIKVRPMGQNRWLVANWREQFILDRSTGKMTELLYGMGPGKSYSGFDLLKVDTQNHWIYVANFFAGTYKLDYSGRVLYNWSSLEITGSATKMLADPQNDSLAWISGTNGITLLNIYTHKTTTFPVQDAASPLPSNFVADIYLDRGAKIWAATYHGLYARNAYPVVKTWDLPVTEDNPLITITKSADGALYMAQYYGDVYRMDGQTAHVEKFGSPAMHDSWFIFEDGPYLIHGGGGTALTRYDRRNGNTFQDHMLSGCFKNSEVLVSGFRHSGGDLWFSANVGGGLARVSGGRITRYCRQNGDFSNSYLTHHAEDRNGDLWLSSNKTSVLLHWIQKEKRFEEKDFALPFDRLGIYRSVIHCLTVGPDGSVWLGFDGSGLLRYTPSTGSYMLYSKKNGLPSNYIHDLVCDGKGRIWAGTKNGLACVDPPTGKIRVFSHENGFPVKGFGDSNAYFDAATHTIWMGVGNKLLAFDPDKLLGYENNIPAVFIDGVEVNNRALDIRDTTVHRLRTDENNIHITFSTLNFDNTGDAVYNYSLGGQWVELGGSREVNFPNLGHGDYEFRLRGKMLGSEEWFYLQRPVRFIIATPWYKSAWFTVLAVLATLGLIFVLTRTYYAAKVRKQKILMEKQLAIQTERDRISFDMHDDLGSGLTKISYLSQIAMNKGGHTQELEKIKNTSQELVGNMSELIWAMKAENDNLPDMLGYLRQYAFEYLGGNRIDVGFDMPEGVADRTILGEKRRNVFLIYKEALHNIVKHAKARNVSVGVGVDTHLRLTITDDGQGFDPETGEAKTGNGLRNMEVRAKRLNGTMHIRSSPGGGTVLDFRFPLDGLS